jgi:pantothenate kinase-related protein Tda10
MLHDPGGGFLEKSPLAVGITGSQGSGIYFKFFKKMVSLDFQ